MFRAAWTVYELDPKKRSRLRYNTFQKMCLAAIQVGIPAAVAARRTCVSADGQLLHKPVAACKPCARRAEYYYSSKLSMPLLL